MLDRNSALAPEDVHAVKPVLYPVEKLDASAHLDELAAAKRYAALFGHAHHGVEISED